MTQGELEKLPLMVQKEWTALENRIMADIVRRIKINGFSTASADWQITRLKQLGQSQAWIEKELKKALKATQDEVDKILSDAAYEEHMKHRRAYQIKGVEQIPFEENQQLQSMLEAMQTQVKNEYTNLANSAAFAEKDLNGRITYTPIGEFYRQKVDGAIMDIESGAFTYEQALKRVVTTMTNSGLRGWVTYDSGHRNRVDVAARRSLLTGWRQIQGQISQQTARDLGTESFEVTVHIGARPSHQVWEGKVWTKEQLVSVCGLGTVTGLHGANCYHDYVPFIPGVSERVYTDEQLEKIHEQENTPKVYQGKEYTTYEALQKQRQLETRMRKYNQDIHLLEEGGGDPDDILAAKIKYKTTMAEYKDFSKQVELPMQKQRIFQNGLKAPDLRGVDVPDEMFDNAKGIMKNVINALHIKDISEINAEGDYIIAKSYTDNINRQGLKLVPYDQLTKEQAKQYGIYFDLGSNIKPKVAEDIVDTLRELTDDYYTSLTCVRNMEKEEAFFRNRTFASTSHEYLRDGATIKINQLLMSKDGGIARVKELCEEGYSVKIKKGLEKKYIITHEFAHSMINMHSPLPGFNPVGVDYKRIKDARKEILTIFKEYTDELNAIEQELRKANNAVLYGYGEELSEAFENAKKYQKLYNETRISKYSTKNADEFMAEGFTDARLGENPNKYSLKVNDILLKYFGKAN